MVQLKLANGNAKDQKSVQEAEANIKQTWEDLMDTAKVEDKDAKLTYQELSDPSSPIVALCGFLYQMQNFCFAELNRSARYKDRSKLETIGPFAAAMGQIIADA